MREAWPYYRRKIYFVLLAVAFILGMHGLYVYYRPIIERDWQFASAVIYGTFKLFLFSPPLGVADNYPFTFEIAKWLAPMLTSALVLTALANRLLHWKNSIANLFGSHVTMFGKSDQGLAFLRNLKKTKPVYRKVLITKDALTDDDKHAYERLGAAVYQEDPRSLSKKEREAFYKQVRLNHSEHILFVDDDETKNYQLFLSILPDLKPDKPVKVHLQMQSPVLMKYVEQAVERRKDTQTGVELIDLHFFTTAALTMERLLGSGGAVRFVKPLLDQLEPGQNALDHLPQVHLFVLGDNELSTELIERSVNDFVVGRDKVKVTLVDSGAKDKEDDFWFNHPELDQALELETHSSLPGKRTFPEIARQPFTALFLNHPDPLVNLAALDYFPNDLPIAFRNQPKLDLRELMTTHPNLLMYGDLGEIMTRDIVLQESLDQAARQFNAHYDEVASVLGGGGSAWEKLSPTKKASSRLSAAHSFMKEAILERYLGSDPIVIRQNLKEDKTRFNHLVETTQGEEFKQVLEDLFRDKPYLQQLSELEHQRWCHSYYAMGYQPSEVKDEVKKTHPCLNCSWDWLMNEAFFRCHPEYDLISVLSLFGEANETTK